MTDTELSTEDLMEQLNSLAEDLPADREKLNRLYREGAMVQKVGDYTLAKSIVVAELVQTVFSAQVDTIILVNDLFQQFAEMLEAVEESAYRETPRALRSLMTALKSSGALSDEAVASVNAILESEDDAQESFLNKEDGELLMDVLVEYRTVLESQNDESSSSARVRAAIEKVTQVTPSFQDPTEDSEKAETPEATEESPPDE